MKPFTKGLTICPLYDMEVWQQTRFSFIRYSFSSMLKVPFVVSIYRSINWSISDCTHLQHFVSQTCCFLTVLDADLYPHTSWRWLSLQLTW